jgi:hypothetical protein
MNKDVCFLPSKYIYIYIYIYIYYTICYLTNHDVRSLIKWVLMGVLIEMVSMK